MTIGEVLDQSIKLLQASGITTARLDCLILLEDIAGKDRAHLLAHPEDSLTDTQSSQLAAFVAQRQKHTPLAYIRGKALFYGRTFCVTPDVLVPRPETETVITLLKGHPLPQHARIADIGTGSGCIGITAALEIPDSEVSLYDISHAALDIARTNAQTLHATVETHENNLLKGLDAAYDVLLANLPYVPETHPVNKAALHEPTLALFSGADGLDAYRMLWMQIGQLSAKPQIIIVESLPSQHHSMAIMARTNNYFLEKTEGYVQLFSV